MSWNWIPCVLPEKDVSAMRIVFKNIHGFNLTTAQQIMLYAVGLEDPAYL